MKFEGGFQGRTNKLVDGCYSFWQGALFPLLHFLLAKSGVHKAPPRSNRINGHFVMYSLLSAPY